MSQYIRTFFQNFRKKPCQIFLDIQNLKKKIKFLRTIIRVLPLLSVRILLN